MARGNGPSIADEPVNQTANVGSTATFTVVAGGNVRSPINGC